MSNSTLPRELLALLLNNNQRAIKAFEEMLKNANDILPSEIEVIKNENEVNLNASQNALSVLTELFIDYTNKVDILNNNLSEILVILNNQDENIEATNGTMAKQNHDSVDLQGGTAFLDSLTMNNGNLINTQTSLNDNTGALIATLNNSPVAGDPTKWLIISDNGTDLYIPAF